MTPSKYENDELVFLSEDTPSDTSEITGVWNVLVVDDDEEIHSVTRLALSDLVLNDKNLHFIHAYSGSEALKTIESMGASIAIILLDVVMEADDAGLTVARIMREEMKILEPRIILRTGQPGYAPEEQVIKYLWTGWSPTEAQFGGVPYDLFHLFLQDNVYSVQQKRYNWMEWEAISMITQMRLHSKDCG